MAKLKLNVLEDLKEVSLSLNHPKSLVKIRSRMDTHTKYKLINFLKQHQRIFTWSINDMVRINLEIITHELEVNQDYPPVRQKRRKFSPVRNKIMNEKVEKLK